MGGQLIFKIMGVILFALIGLGGTTQVDLPMTGDASRIFQSGDLSGAREKIDAAVLDDLEKEHPYTWYVRGFIYKEMYKQLEKLYLYSENREIALASIQQSMLLDPQNKYWENNQKAIKFLADSYYNDAVVISRSLGKDNLDQPEFFFSKYKNARVIAEPDYDFSEQELIMYKSLAKGYNQIYVQDLDQNIEYIARSIEYYEKALAIQPDDYESNYNTAISYYNQGVQKIRKVNHNTDIFELIVIQDQCVELFKSSLPYMLAAHEMNQERKETLKGLMAIYYSLSDYERSKYYKETLLRLIEEGKIEE